MIYKDLDFFILRNILSSKLRISTWILARKFNWDDRTLEKNKDDYYWTKKCNNIIKRLKVMEKEGLIVIFKNKFNGNKAEYNLVGENVKIKKIKLPDGKYRQCLFIKETNSKWQIFEI